MNPYSCVPNRRTGTIAFLEEKIQPGTAITDGTFCSSDLHLGHKRSYHLVLAFFLVCSLNWLSIDKHVFT